MSFEAPDQEKLEIVRFFNEFFERHSNTFQPKVNVMIEKGENRIIVDLNDLRSYNSEKTRNLLDNPVLYMPCFDKAFEDFIGTIDPSYLKTCVMGLHVGLEGNFGVYHVDPRSLSSRFLSKMVSMEGIVTKCSLVRPKVQRSVHYCDGTGKWMFRDYHDATSLTSNIPTSGIYPTDDGEGHTLTTEFGLCVFKDYQRLTIQEMPERAPPGQLPRSVDVIAEEDLVDQCKPGDRIQCVGIFRTLPSKTYNVTNGMFRTALLANYLRLTTTKDAYMPAVGERDILNIRQLAKQHDNIFELLSSSLAPSIYGHEFVKRALLLQLLGGQEKNLLNGTHLRGDVNILLIGDPSTAKSQLLRFVLNMAPLAVATTGRGSSGVGLTAAVTMDKETGERRLEAGAMVLADRGIVCIDEFDKMSDADRVAIHEVMEQQTVTIAKAGIHASFNARCSVLAAANPIFGQYNPQKTPTENIALPDSLLSRFDLLFVILDQMDPTRDRELSMHVLRMHAYRKAGEEEGAPALDLYDRRHTGLASMLAQESARGTDEGGVDEGLGEENDRAAGETPVFESGERFGTTTTTAKAREDTLTLGFLKKYLHYAKSRVKPVLTKEASVMISQYYSELRRNESSTNKGNSKQHKTLPVTPRTLETLIRLSTAHAKSRLNTTVDIEDVEEAYTIMRFALYKEIERKPRKKKHGEEEEEEEEMIGVSKQARIEESSNRTSQDLSLSLSMTMGDESGNAVGSQQQDDRLKALRRAVLAVTRNARKSECTLDDILNQLQHDENEIPIDAKEVVNMLSQLDAQGTLMFREGRIYLMD